MKTHGTQDAMRQHALTRDTVQAREPIPKPGTMEHREWLLDEAVEQTFPASDPPATSYPGSSLYELTRRERMLRQRTIAGVLIGFACVVVGVSMFRSHRRRRAAVPA